MIILLAPNDSYLHVINFVSFRIGIWIKSESHTFESFFFVCVWIPCFKVQHTHVFPLLKFMKIKI